MDVAETRNLTEKSLPWRVSNNLAAWYLVAASSDIAEGQIRPASLGSREIVLFRTKGRIHALDPHCSHMGAKLCQGKIDGEHLVCPLHGWRYSGNGEVAGGMGRIRSWPVQETLGGILVFNGPKPLYAPPAHQPEFRWGGAASTLIDAPWFALTANAFDTHHYEAVHRRKLLEPPTLEHTDRYLFSCSYLSQVTGGHFSDRVMQYLATRGIRVTMTCYGGPLFTVHSILDDRQASLMVGMEPVGDQTRLRLLVGSQGGKLTALIARYLYTSFLRSDLKPMSGVRLQPFTGLEVDAVIERFARYLESLPEAE